MVDGLCWIAPLAGLAIGAAAGAEASGAAPSEPLAAIAPERRTAKLSAAQLFVVADAALKRGDGVTAEAAYRALAGDRDPEIRSEARFRLGMVYSALGRHVDAARLFRRILDDKPDAQRVRLELARILDAMGDEAGARRALREAQAGELPPEVARFVDRYSAALRSRKPFGASIELAFAPDSNINRATRSDTLGTVLGDFTLDKDAKQRSGVGVAARGQAFARVRVGDRVNLLARVSGSADLYRDGDFNDFLLSVAAGPEWRLGSDRLTGEVGITRHWFGGQSFATTRDLAINYSHPLDRQSQVRGSAGFGLIDNKRNPLQDGRRYSASLSYERAISNRFGIGGSVARDRQALGDPGYSLTSSQITLFGYREIGSATLVATLGYGRLAADERLAIYPRRRLDNLYRGSLALTFRKLGIGSFAPLIRVTGERNRSSVELFGYRRIRTEFGITRAF